MSKLNELELLLKQGKITRRGFLTQVSALGLTAALSPALLTTLARAETPKKGGRLRVGMVGFSTTDSWDPQKLTNIRPRCLLRF